MIPRRRPGENAKAQLAPMIDMVFLLLVFFMVTTRITNQKKQVKLTLPMARAAQVPDDHDNREIINIDGNNQFYIGDRPVALPELKKHLRLRFANSPPLKVYVRADKNTEAKQIKTIMKAAAEAGAIEVLFGTHNK